MTGIENSQLVDISPDLLNKCCQQIWHYTVGFLRVEEVGNHADAKLLGSGVLVETGRTKAVLTADHVGQVLPHSGRLGLVLSKKVEKTTIDVTGLEYLQIARGKNDEEGPDIGAGILSEHTASVIEAKKSFYNLDKFASAAMNGRADDKLGFWIVQGFVDELTTEKSDETHNKKVKGFTSFSAAGDIGDYVSDGDHDFYVFPVDKAPSDNIPENFGGCSGGGLWQVLLKQEKGEEVTIDKILLKGIAYYQISPNNGASALKTHGPKSVYEVARSSIMKTKSD